MASGGITLLEALLRWNHPKLGLISPAEFIPLLEESGLIIEVGAWPLKTACLQNVLSQKEGTPPVRMAVNVSTQQFCPGNIVRTVRHHPPAQRLSTDLDGVLLKQDLGRQGRTEISVLRPDQFDGVLPHAGVHSWFEAPPRAWWISAPAPPS
jgi:hypothetical protein